MSDSGDVVSVGETVDVSVRHSCSSITKSGGEPGLNGAGRYPSSLNISGPAW